ncbi:hypothetical protein UACE39S_00997 [Ureibacillus acetophenoni]
MGTLDNLIFECRKYLESIGVNPTEVYELLNNDIFENGIIIKLANVNVVKENRAQGYTSKQTHIHVTGESMEYFYPKSVLDTVKDSTEDEEIKVNLLSSNLEHLYTIKEDRRNRDFRVSQKVQVYTTKTVKKIGHNGSQVQISKKRFDGKEFKEFRDLLFPGDILVFLKYIDHDMGHLVIGLPVDFVRTTHLDYQENTFFKKEEMEIIPTDFRIQLNRVTAEKIANYELNEIEEDYEGIFDLSESINNRMIRTSRHQKMVKKLAAILEDGGFLLFEGNIDCLATKEDYDTLIFEAKTLDGTATDEAKQVRLALGQLLYYEKFATLEFSNDVIQKIAYFESEISSHHKELLRDYNCLVIWINKNGNVEGDIELFNFL